MEHVENNSLIEIEKSIQRGLIPKKWPIIMLLVRTFLFLIIGLKIAIFFSLKGAEPLKAVVPWWPFQVIIANVICFGILYYLTKKEGIKYIDLINLKGKLKQDAIVTIIFLFVGSLAGGIGLFGGSFLIFGAMPPQTMFQPLPFWAAALVLILLPLTNAMVETVTYIGYCLPRLEAIFKSTWFAIALSAFWLSFQHVVVPITVDLKFMLWRFVSFLPLALAIGITYAKTRRLTPIMIVHFLLDLQSVIMVFIVSIK